MRIQKSVDKSNAGLRCEAVLDEFKKAEGRRQKGTNWKGIET
jgi:hypothetical protein